MDQLQKAQFLEILEKYHAGNASKEEVEFLDAYYKAFGLRNGYTDYLTEEDRLLLKNELKNSISKKKFRRTREVKSKQITGIFSNGQFLLLRQ